MHNVQIDPLKNRLYITLRDSNYADIKKCVDEIENACKYLAAGFTCLTVLDINRLVRQSDKDLLFNTADLVYAYGASKIVHVRDNNDATVFLQPSLMNFQTYFPVENAKNIQEAEDILDQKNQATRAN